MVLFTILLMFLVALGIVSICIGGSFLLIFGDVIMFVLILALIIKLIFKKNKKKE